jgi:hypothetical protein
MDVRVLDREAEASRARTEANESRSRYRSGIRERGGEATAWREEGLLSRPAEVQEEGLVRNTEEGEAVTRSYEAVAATREAPGL